MTSPRRQPALACGLIVSAVTILTWATSKPSSPYTTLALYDAAEVPEMTCPNENERLLTRYMAHWEAALIRYLQNGSAEAPPRIEPTSWKVLLKDSVHVFSAYLANASVWGVHVVSLVRRDVELYNWTASSVAVVKCLVRTANGESLLKPVVLKKMWEEFPHEFVRAHLICPLQGVTDLREPASIILVTTGGTHTEQVELPVLKPPERAPVKCCSVCVRPTYGRSTRLWEVVEFVTHYKLMGARSFFLYDLDMSQAMLKLVGRLQAEHWDVTLVPFKLTVPYNESNVAWGQTAMLSDCAFRSRFKSEYFVNVDFDELAVPSAQYGVDLSALIDSVERSRGAEKVGSLILRNRVFCYEHQVKHEYARQDVLPLMSRILDNHVGVVDNNFTLKYIARAGAVCSPAIHRVTEFCHESEEAILLNSSELVMNHYRKCCDYGVGKEKSWGVDYRNPGRLFVDDSAKALSRSLDGLLPSVALTLLRFGPEVGQIYDSQIKNVSGNQEISVQS